MWAEECSSITSASIAEGVDIDIELVQLTQVLLHLIEVALVDDPVDAGLGPVLERVQTLFHCAPAIQRYNNKLVLPQSLKRHHGSAMGPTTYIV